MVKKSLIQLNLTNRGFYSLIALVILAFAGLSVWALTPGTAPNPGHTLSEISPPSPCNAGEILSWNGTGWDCINSGGGSLWKESGSNIYYDTGNVGIGTATPSQKLTVAGTIESTSGGFKFPDGTVQSSKYSISCNWAGSRTITLTNPGGECCPTTFTCTNGVITSITM